MQPKVFLGNSVTGYGADSTRKAFTKYNEHTHSSAFLNSFLYEPIEKGDEVQLFIDGEEVLAYTGIPNLPTILTITENYLEVTTQALASGVGDLVVNGVTYSQVVATEGSNQLTRLSEAPGFITPASLRSALTHTFSGTTAIDTDNPTILDPENLSDLMAVLGQPPLSIPVQSFPLLLSAPFAFRAVKLYLLPQWTVNSVNRAAAIRIARNGEAFSYLADLYNLTQTGRVTIPLNSNSVSQNDAVYIQVFNPLNLARLSYQLDVVAV